MSEFTRKNTLQCSGTFTPVNGVGAPASAEAVLVYTNTSGATQTDRVALTLGTDGVTWTGLWDSSAAAPGCVQWAIHCWNGLQAAIDGEFTIKANAANLAIS